MIYIDKNTTNNIYLTLSESTSIANPYYLFELDYEGYTTPQPIYYYTPDISSYTNRYNEFILVDSDITGTFSSTQSSISFTSSINLKNGQYKYTIFVSDNPIDVNNLSGVTSSNNIIEIGRMVVNGIDTTIDEIYL
jgi:hypothetical protein